MQHSFHHDKILNQSGGHNIFSVGVTYVPQLRQDFGANACAPLHGYREAACENKWYSGLLSWARTVHSKPRGLRTLTTACAYVVFFCSLAHELHLDAAPTTVRIGLWIITESINLTDVTPDASTVLLLFLPA